MAEICLLRRDNVHIVNRVVRFRDHAPGFPAKDARFAQLSAITLVTVKAAATSFCASLAWYAGLFTSATIWSLT